jgi:hypothetical protein
MNQQENLVGSLNILSYLNKIDIFVLYKLNLFVNHFATFGFAVSKLGSIFCIHLFLKSTNVYVGF